VLFQSIKERQRLASTVSCHYWNQRGASTFMIDATCSPEKKDALRRALDEDLERFAREPISEEQFRRAVRLTASGHLFSFETTGAASSQIGYFQTLTGSTQLLDDFLKQLADVTPDEVRSAFGRMMERAEWVEVSVGPDAQGDSAGTQSPESTGGENGR
jgi:zinc protease